MSDCIFCKIVNGEIPAAKVYEDEHVLAFMDIMQVTKGHTLVIPKVHKQDIFELTPDIAQHLFKVVPQIAQAIKEKFNPEGLNIVNNNGKLPAKRYSITICTLYLVTEKVTASVSYGNPMPINTQQTTFTHLLPQLKKDCLFNLREL